MSTRSNKNSNKNANIAEESGDIAENVVTNDADNSSNNDNNHEDKKMKYTVVTKSSHQHLIKTIKDIENKASEIKEKIKFVIQKYSSK